MDVLSDVLERAGAGAATVRQLIRQPPWAMTFADAPTLTVVAALGGQVSIRIDDADGTPYRLAAGDIALISGTSRYTIGDSPATQPEVVFQHGKPYFLETGEEVTVGPDLPARTCGDGGLPGATTMLWSAYQLRDGLSDRLLEMLPPVAIIPAGPRTRAVLDLLTTETGSDEPGQDAILARLLDLVLVVSLRAWWAKPDATPPAWYRALADASVGEALRLVHEDPAYRWTVSSLADQVGLSRAAFAARFSKLVGEPPLTYLTGWRMTLGADLLRDTDSTIAAIAHEVGYHDTFAFSVAFKRTHGVSPSTWRREHTAHTA
jgi:AraC-like DNA-binding protein